MGSMGGCPTALSCKLRVSMMFLRGLWGPANLLKGWGRGGAGEGCRGAGEVQLVLSLSSYLKLRATKTNDSREVGIYHALGCWQGEFQYSLSLAFIY